MAIYLPQHLPAIETVRAEGLPVFGGRPGNGTHALRVLFLNLMPMKQTTELDFIRVLAPFEGAVELIPMKIAGQTYKHASPEYMNAFYRDFEALQDDCYDGLIVTGAPVEQMPFENVRYWPQLCRIFSWARKNVRSTLYICWGAQAGLFYHHGISKHPIPEKMFGIFPQQILAPQEKLFAGAGPSILMPQSRHTEVRETDIALKPELRVLARSEESGVAIVKTRGRNEIFVTGHLEYAALTLHNEYGRDRSRGLHILPPAHYYPSDNASLAPAFTWRADALRFYQNWLTHYVQPPCPESQER